MTTWSEVWRAPEIGENQIGRKGVGEAKNATKTSVQGRLPVVATPRKPKRQLSKNEIQEALQKTMKSGKLEARSQKACEKLLEQLGLVSPSLPNYLLQTTELPAMKAFRSACPDDPKKQRTLHFTVMLAWKTCKEIHSRSCQIDSLV